MCALCTLHWRTYSALNRVPLLRASASNSFGYSRGMAEGGLDIFTAVVIISESIVELIEDQHSWGSFLNHKIPLVCLIFCLYSSFFFLCFFFVSKGDDTAHGRIFVRISETKSKKLFASDLGGGGGREREWEREKSKSNAILEERKRKSFFFLYISLHNPGKKNKSPKIFLRMPK